MGNIEKKTSLKKSHYNIIILVAYICIVIQVIIYVCSYSSDIIIVIRSRSIKIWVFQRNRIANVSHVRPSPAPYQEGV